MKNKELADIFSRIADVLEFKGEVIFKINAYRKASRILDELTDSVKDLVATDSLKDIPGIGKGLEEKIHEYLDTGKIEEFDALLTTIPRDLFDLLSIQNFGPKTAAAAFEKLGIETVNDLEKAIETGSLQTLPGMGAKKIENIRRGVQLFKSASQRISIGIAWPVVDYVIEYLKEHRGKLVQDIMPAGSVRRNRETVHDIDIIVSTTDPESVMNCFRDIPRRTRVLAAGSTKASIMLDERFQVDLRVIPHESFGAALQYFTGSKEHNVRLRELARKRGLKINEYGVYQDEHKVAGESEEDIYRILDMPFIPPELREDRGEIDAAMDDRLPDLMTIGEIKADLHIHSTYSDGQLSLADMAKLVRDRGYEYMAFCDHSASAFYANGVSVPKLSQQIKEIRSLNETYSDFEILAGSEVDIQPDGSLDLPDEILQKLDFVIASLHTAFKTDPTLRTIKAMKNPFVDLIGHPTGRLISRREGFEIDMDRILDVAAETGTALEINSFWDRLDLRDIHVRAAIDRGVKLCINTDAHHREHLPMMHLGVGTARRGWATAADVINTFNLESLKNWQKRNHA